MIHVLQHGKKRPHLKSGFPPSPSWEAGDCSQPPLMAHRDIVNWTLGNKLQWNLKQILYIFIQENAYGNVVRKLAGILSRPQYVNWLAPGRCDTNYRQPSNIKRTLVDNKIVDHSDVVGAPPVCAAPTTSSFSTWRLVSMDWGKTTARGCENQLSFVIWCALY